MLKLHREGLGFNIARLRLHATLPQKRAAQLAARVRVFARKRRRCCRSGVGHGICRGAHLGRQVGIVGIGRNKWNRPRFGRRFHHGFQLSLTDLGRVKHALAFGRDLRNIDARDGFELRRRIGHHGALFFGGLARLFASFGGSFHLHTGHAQAQYRKVSVVFALQKPRGMAAFGIERGLHVFQILQSMLFGSDDELRHFAPAFVGHIRTANFVHNEANRPCERGLLTQIGPRKNRAGRNARTRHDGSARAKRGSKL